jgi:hypothetical protein
MCIPGPGAKQSTLLYLLSDQMCVRGLTGLCVDGWPISQVDRELSLSMRREWFTNQNWLTSSRGSPKKDWQPAGPCIFVILDKYTSSRSKRSRCEMTTRSWTRNISENLCFLTELIRRHADSHIRRPFRNQERIFPIGQQTGANLNYAS